MIWDGNGAANSLQFNNIIVPQTGQYRMVIYFANAEYRGGHAYNSQVVDRFADIRVNDGCTQRFYFRNTFTWENFQSRVVDVTLSAGNNSILIYNGDYNAQAPHIDKIEIAAPYSF